MPCQFNQILYYWKDHNPPFYEVVTMLYEEQNTFRRTPGLVTWLFWSQLSSQCALH